MSLKRADPKHHAISSKVTSLENINKKGLVWSSSDSENKANSDI